MKSLGLVALLVAVLVAPLGAADSYGQMLELESRRSLGDGRLALYLASPDEQVAVRAALAIGRTKLAAGDALLAAHLADSRVPVRAMATYGIGLLATGSQAPELTRAVNDPSGAVRVAALDALARYEAAKRLPGSDSILAQGAIERALSGDSDRIVRARAATALVEFRDGRGSPEAADALARAFRSDRDTFVRWHVMWSIYRGYAHAVNFRLLENALRDRDELVRIEAVRAIGRYRNPAFVALVRPLLQDPSWRVQEQASETIRLLRGQPPTQHWTAIPSYVHSPPVAADPLARLPPMAREHPGAKPAASTVEQVTTRLRLDPATARAMTSPVRGPHPRVRIATTKGNLYVVLYPEWAPLTVANFLNLADRGYYDHNRWFRIVPDFVVQTGDPNDNGEGDAGYSIGAEENPIEQSSYIISMGLNYDDKTNTPIRDSAGAQYYITLSPQLHLDRDFSVFGAMTAGFDVLGRLVESDRVIRVERIADVMLR